MSENEESVSEVVRDVLDGFPVEASPDVPDPSAGSSSAQAQVLFVV